MLFSFAIGVGTGVYIVNRYDTSKIKKIIEEKMNCKEYKMKDVLDRLQKLEKELQRKEDKNDV